MLESLLTPLSFGGVPQTCPSLSTQPRTLIIPPGLRLQMDLLFENNHLQEVDLHFVYLPPSLRRSGVWSSFVKGALHQFLHGNPSIGFKVSCIINPRVQYSLEKLECFVPLADETSDVLTLFRPPTILPAKIPTQSSQATGTFERTGATSTEHAKSTSSQEQGPFLTKSATLSS